MSCSALAGGGVVLPRPVRGYGGRIACAARGRKRRKSRAAIGPPQGRGCGFPPRPFRRRGPEAASPLMTRPGGRILVMAAVWRPPPPWPLRIAIVIDVCVNGAQ